ncbi:efflux RND transporter periplasmic adaptor subunit [Sphingobium estronivorans]|uniref:efflux RND transporter periplasmic adaptor subunit n=1 Tax=Sphingobium estronivorans TaxID=1577690 RepID=UPI001238C859|nr:efflux RND transporter periplasmic adaptor subunit [Sphingobium estronivorans]
MRKVAAFSGLLLLAGCGSSAQQDPTPTPKTLVTTALLRRGSQPEWVTAYGSAMPAVNGAQTLSINQPGQVTSLLVVAGTAVRAGQTLAVFTTAPTAVSAYEQAVTALTTAQKQRSTTAQLLSQQLATKDQLAQSEKAVLDAQAALAALKREGAGVAVRSIVAPFDGVITNIAVAQGDRPQPGAPLITVAHAGDIIATVGIDAAIAGQVHVGQRARVARLNGSPPIVGKVIMTNAILNPRTRQIDIGVAFPAGAFMPNEALKADIAVREVQGWLVPHKAIVTAGGPPRLFQLVGGKAKAVAVKLLLTGDETDVVDGPIDPNRLLILDGAYQVNDGDAVRTGRPS